MNGVARRMEREGKSVRLRSAESKWEVNVLLYVDDAVMVEESEEKLKILMRKFESKCVSRGLSVNQTKSKVMSIVREDEV